MGLYDKFGDAGDLYDSFRARSKNKQEILLLTLRLEVEGLQKQILEMQQDIQSLKNFRSLYDPSYSPFNKGINNASK